MKYRIIHEPKSFEKNCYNGGEYKVQYKSLLFWKTPKIDVENNMKTMLDPSHITIDRTFKTTDAAERYINNLKSKLNKGKTLIKEL